MPDMAEQAVYLQPSPSQVGLRNCCPRCGEGKLFQGMLAPAKRCMNCDLDYEFIDSGDGPAVFVILIIGFVTAGMAMALQTTLSPPLWVHMIVWTPLVIVLSIWGLRVSKGMMIAFQFQTKAHEGELRDEDQ